MTTCSKAVTGKRAYDPISCSTLYSTYSNYYHIELRGIFELSISAEIKT